MWHMVSNIVRGVATIFNWYSDYIFTNPVADDYKNTKFEDKTFSIRFFHVFMKQKMLSGCVPVYMVATPLIVMYYQQSLRKM